MNYLLQFWVRINVIAMFRKVINKSGHACEKSNGITLPFLQRDSELRWKSYYIKLYRDMCLRH